MTFDDQRGLERVLGFLTDVFGEAWQTGLVITPDSSLIYDLGFASIELIVLLERLDAAFPEARLPEIFQGDDAMIRDVRLRDLARFIDESAPP